jgi:hypothetical protein
MGLMATIISPNGPKRLYSLFSVSEIRNFPIDEYSPSALGVEGTFNCQTTPLKDMGVDHGSADVLVPQ